MRPVTKLDYGEEITLPDGSTHTIEDPYKPHGEAKDPLSENIGKYCSYCERPLSNNDALAIEHVKAKSLPQHANLKFSWSNFLLSCARCNGSDNKGTKDVIFDEIHLPHRNNTLLSIQYGEGGSVQIHPKLTPGSAEYSKARKLIKLVGLDKCPAYPAKDRRWSDRFEVWLKAKKYEPYYRLRKISLEAIIDLAESNGFFSVWFTIFRDFPEVRKALIDNFPGTTISCFDAKNDYNPIPRNPPAI